MAADEWAKVNQALYEARKATLKSLGYTHKDYKRLEQTTIDEMVDQDLEFLRTEFGDVQLIQTCIYLTKKEKGVVGYSHKLNLVKK